jgi:hypothetical protein
LVEAATKSGRLRCPVWGQEIAIAAGIRLRDHVDREAAGRQPFTLCLLLGECPDEAQKHRPVVKDYDDRIRRLMSTWKRSSVLVEASRRFS